LEVDDIAINSHKGRNIQGGQGRTVAVYLLNKETERKAVAYATDGLPSVGNAVRDLTFGGAWQDPNSWKALFSGFWSVSR
jgi:hypothetical protein